MNCLQYGNRTYRPEVLFTKIRNNPDFFIKKHNITNADIERVLKVEEQSEMSLSVLKPTDFDSNGNVLPEVLAEIQAEKEQIIAQAKANGTYMKAPNGKPTNLNEEQWALVRTQRFKDWFGDWESASLINMAEKVWSGDKGTQKTTFNISDKLKNELQNILGKDIKSAFITDSDIRHIKNHHGKNEEKRGQENITPQDIALIPFVMNEFDSVEHTETDNLGNRKVIFSKRINGNVYVASIERGKSKEQAITMWKKSSRVVDADQSPSNPTPETTSLDYANIKQKAENIKNSANNSSKVVDDNGEPLVVYHGTRADFTEFDIEKSGQSNTISKIGFWFSTEKGFGKKFAEEIWYGKEEAKELGVFLNIKNPKIFYGGKSENHLEIENEIKETSQAIKKIERKYHSDYADFDDIYRFQTDYRLYKNGNNIDHSQFKEDIYKIVELQNKLNSLEEVHNENIYSDAYQKFKTSIYKTAGQTSRDANIGGTGMSINGGVSTINEYRSQLKGNNQDGIFINNTKVDSDSSSNPTNTQIIVLDPNQIKSATDNVGTYSEDSDDIRYHKGDSQSVNELFNKELEQLRKEQLPAGHIFQLGTPNAILQSAGLPNLPIEMSATRLKNKSEQENHPFDLSEVENLPQAIQNPIAVFDSTKGNETKVILTELQTKKGDNYVVAMRVSNKGRGRNSIEINDIKSIYPKNHFEGVLDWINSADNLMKYADTKKLLDYISVQSTNLIGNGNTNTVQSQSRSNANLQKKIETAKEKVQDLITQQQTNLAEVSYLDLNSIANIINNFKNPKIDAIDYQIVGEQEPYFSVLPINE